MHIKALMARYLLPGTATGGRETLLTSTLAAEPQYLLPMPKPSPWPIWAAVFTAGFFLLLTVQAYWPSVISGVLGIYCILQWCWMLDRPLAQKDADVGAGIRLPTYATGPSSHGWWAMIITLIVSGMVLAMNAFSYVFLWSRNLEMWAPPPGLRSLAIIMAANAVAVLLAWGACRVLRLGRPRSPVASALMIAAAAALVCIGWGVDLQSWRETGLRPSINAQGASVYSLVGWQGFFTAIVALMGFYALVRWAARHVAATAPPPST